MRGDLANPASGSGSQSADVLYAKAPKNKAKPVNSFLSGIAGGFTGAVFLTPFDVIRTRIQAGMSQSAGSSFTRDLTHFSRQIYNEAGFRGFYRGFNPTVIALVPNWAIFFCAYEKVRNNMEDITGRNTIATNIIGSLCAGVVTTLVVNPLWYARTQLMTKNGDVSQKSTYGLIRELIQREGIKGLQKGLAPSLLGLGHIAIYLPLFEHLRVSLDPASEAHDSKEGMINGTALVESILLAKLVASMVSYPHEVLRTRLYLTDAKTHGENHGIVEETRSILRNEGVKGLYRGLGITLVRTLPGTVVVFYTKEHVNQWLERNGF